MNSDQHQNLSSKIPYPRPLLLSRRGFLKQATLASLGLAVSRGRSLYAQKSGFDEVVRIGYLPITDAASLLVAHELGFFKQEGLKSQKPTLIRGWSPLVESFIADKFNLVHLLKPIPIWMRFQNSLPIKIVAWAHTNGSALLVGKHTGVKTISELGGKSLAVPYWYSIHNVILQKVLRHHGLTPVIQDQSKKLKRNEVNLQILPPPDMPLALLAKKIDGYIVAEPFNALGELKAGATILRFTGDIWKNHPCCVITVNEGYLDRYPDWSQKVVNAIVKSEIYISQNKREVAKVLSKDKSGLLPFPAEVVERAMLHYNDSEYEAIGANRNQKSWQNGRIDFQPFPYPSATEYLIDAMGDTLVEGDKSFLNRLNVKKAAEEVVDKRWVIKALKDQPDWINDPSVTNKKNPLVRKEIFDI